ncbi:MAG: T9SS type A sorting domain-containing protein, partial [Muribaculaceae bacterium]|nr:T9SS type A sorting domain-containing protein [Muribaculaceae bacterium]
KTQPNWQDSFAAEKWCASKTDGNLQWYLPAIDELRQLFAATCGLVWHAPGADTNNAQINPNWTDLLQTMLAGDNINPFPDARAAFNKKFTNIGATPLNSDNTMRYWSSTQYESDFAMLLSFEGGYSMAQPRQYDHIGNTRAIAAFQAKQQGGTTGIGSIAATTSGLKISVAGGSAIVTAGVDIASVQVYAITGTATGTNVTISGTTANIDIEHLPAGTYIVTATGVDGTRSSAKLLKR